MAIKNLINGKFVDELAAHDRGLHYGDGLFETITVENMQLLCWDEHLKRLERGCIKLNIAVPDKNLLKNEVSELINTESQGVIKIIISRGQGGRGYKILENIAPTRIISLYPWSYQYDQNSSSGVKTRICKYRYAKNPLLAGIKHLNRLEQILARSEWNDDSIAEGIVMDSENYIIEGTMSNIFCIIGKTLYTPDLSACGIEGIVRGKIIELASNLKFNVEIKKMPLGFLMNAEEIFMCNSIIGVWPVNIIDETKFSKHKKTQNIIKTLQEYNSIPKLCKNIN
jgi:4-amino-4-deoxychorismate lyase